MSLVFAGIVSHAPGITGRSQMADAGIVQEFHSAFRGMGERLLRPRPDALVMVSAEHFANFFMNNMPSFAVGMADQYEGPIEDPEWLGIARTKVPGDANLSLRMIREIMQTVDVALCRGMEIRSRDHGAAAFSDAALRCSRGTGEYQLPGTAIDPAAPCVGLGRGHSPCRGPPSATYRCGGCGRDLALAGDAGLRKDQRVLGSRFLRGLDANDKPAMLSYNR